MCGIVGYVGREEAVPVLLQGLYKLEYRGYDSAGVAVLRPEGLKVVKTKGRIKNLEDKVQQVGGMEATCGIGHTRWATHGEPSDVNAHPHISRNGRIAIVHNGIIENYLELREMLTKEGYEMQSQTDTEVVAHLFEYHFKGDMMQALMDTVKDLRGSYALGILSADDPGEIYCTKRDNPLIIGVGEGENLIASDIPAIIQKTKHYIVLEDNQIARITPDSVEVFNAFGQKLEPEVQTVNWDISSAEKGGYEHFMIKEIMEQPEAIRKTISPRIKDGRIVLDDWRLTARELEEMDRLYIIACGSSYHVGVAAKYILEKLLRKPVEVTLASEFRYCDPIVSERTLSLVISQSGETIDTLAAMREAKRLGAKVVSIVNVVGSTIARESDSVLYTWAGPEIAVATTKAYSTQLAVIYLIGLYCADLLGTLDRANYDAILAELQRIPDKLQEILENREDIQYFASLYFNRPSMFFIGRNLDYAVGLEGSLKLKEISYIHSEAYAAGELKHGTISLIEPGTLVVALAGCGPLFEKTVSNAVEVKSRGADVLGLTTRDRAADLSRTADHVIAIPETHPMLLPSLAVVPMQLFAYYTALQRGCDIDKPRNLAKSVTVE